MTDSITSTPAEIADALDARADALMAGPHSEDGTMEVSPWVVSELDRAAAARLRAMDEALKPLLTSTRFTWSDNIPDDAAVFVMRNGVAHWDAAFSYGALRAARTARGET